MSANQQPSVAECPSRMSHPFAVACSSCGYQRGRGTCKASGPAQPVSPHVTMAMVEAAIRAWNVAEPDMNIVGVSYHRTFAEVITAALAAVGKGSSEVGS